MASSKRQALGHIVEVPPDEARAGPPAQVISEPRCSPSFQLPVLSQVEHVDSWQQRAGLVLSHPAHVGRTAPRETRRDDTHGGVTDGSVRVRKRRGRVTDLHFYALGAADDLVVQAAIR